MSDTLSGKENLLGWHYNCGTPIVIYMVEVLVYLHHNSVLPIVHNMSNKVLSGVFEGKVAGTGAAKIVSFASKVVVFMNVTRESYGYIALVRWRKRKKWDPGWNLNMCIPCWSSKFKQWDLAISCSVYAELSNSAKEHNPQLTIDHTSLNSALIT
ncbi:hypothetical protein L195_g012982 [Trifolium pratense]|uniref:Uncharacterized protein n=2 Tax=Trifolium pratense TaxID=57577 RepID=A0A2K3PLV3_TRIPR|nr:hypothetical protein L195_g012982 [Trifolium pratense]